MKTRNTWAHKTPLSRGLDPKTGYPKDNKLLRQELGKVLKRVLSKMSPKQREAMKKMEEHFKATAKARRQAEGRS